MPNNILNGRHKILNLTCQNFWEERNENLKVVKYTCKLLCKGLE